MELKDFTLAPTPAPYSPEAKSTIAEKLAQAAETVKAAIVRAEEVVTDVAKTALHLKDPNWKGEGYEPEGIEVDVPEGVAIAETAPAVTATVVEVTDTHVVLEETPVEQGDDAKETPASDEQTEA